MEETASLNKRERKRQRRAADPGVAARRAVFEARLGLADGAPDGKGALEGNGGKGAAHGGGQGGKGAKGAKGAKDKDGKDKDAKGAKGAKDKDGKGAKGAKGAKDEGGKGKRLCPRRTRSERPRLQPRRSERTGHGNLHCRLSCVGCVDRIASIGCLVFALHGSHCLRCLHCSHGPHCVWSFCAQFGRPKRSTASSSK